METIVAIDTFDPEGTQNMRDVFPDVIEPGNPLHATWPEHAVGLLVAKSRITASMIHNAAKLKIIVRHGTGYDNIDVEACQEKGVMLSYCPGISAMNVAEMVLALTGACAKNLVQVGRQLRAGERLGKKKSKSLYSAALLTGKTVGVVGGGTIGRLVARKFIGAYEANIIVYDPALDRATWDQIPHTRVSTVDELLPQVDILTLHVPLLADTKDIIAKPQLSLMKSTSILINTARGGIVNESDLWEALRDGTIASAGVDAWVHEPPTREDYGDVFDLENLVMTPHVGGSPKEIQTKTCQAMVDRMKEFVEGVEVRDRVC